VFGEELHIFFFLRDGFIIENVLFLDEDQGVNTMEPFLYFKDPVWRDGSG
jgi:hypothetical protein